MAAEERAAPATGESAQSALERRVAADARTPLGPPQGYQRRTYRVVRALFKVVALAFGRVEVVGADTLPDDEVFVLAPVHRSNVDFALVSLLTRRRMRYMGKDGIWRFRPLGRFVSMLGAFPVHRGSADREAMKVCEIVLAHGEPLVMFPEGTRKSGPVVETLFDGTAYVAARAGVPLYPVGIGGSEAMMPKGAKFLHPAKLVLVVGERIDAPAASAGGRVSRSSVRDTTARLQRDLQALFDRAQAMAGRPNPPRDEVPTPTDLPRSPG